MFYNRQFRDYSRSHPAELAFCALYMVLQFTYNSPFASRMDFPRYSIPVIPFLVLSAERWIPKNRPTSVGLRPWIGGARGCLDDWHSGDT